MSDYIPYVKPEDEDARYRLFTRKFYCRVPNLQTRSVEHIRYFGTPFSGDPRFDLQMSREVVDRYLTIVQMVEFHNEGINIAVKDYNDTKKIYDIIVEHLKDWERKVIRDGQIHPVVSKDLIMLDAFAKVVYDKAKYITETDQFIGSLLVNSMRDVYDVQIEDMLPHPDAKTHKVEADGSKEEHYPEYISMAQAFADAAPARVRKDKEASHKTRFQKTNEEDFVVGNGITSARWGG